jgi:hydrogenase expression/formation protein HypE
MDTERVTLGMGGGGLLSARIISEVFLAGYGNEALNRLDDAAEVSLDGARLAFTTDSYTVKPVFFPGGDIGRLAVCGTANDLSVKGARPRAISSAFIIEEGFLLDDLKRIVRSMRDTAAEAGVEIVTGDTKVVRKGEADGVFITSSGIGAIIPGMEISCAAARPGDSIIVSGTVGDHGAAIMNARERLGFTPEIVSDVAPVRGIVEALAPRARALRAMRDPTRGGLASALNEIARASGVSVRVLEDRVPVAAGVRACCEILGLDPLYMACEGRVLIFAAPDSAEEVLRLIRGAPGGTNAALIGEVAGPGGDPNVPPVIVETGFGTQRFLPLLDGDPVPRIC